MTEGRAAWNAVTSFQEPEARNVNRDEQFPRDQRCERADEFLEVAGRLWDRWEDDALVLDTEQSLLAERWSDVIFCSHASLESARDFYTEIRDRVAAHGHPRHPHRGARVPSTGFRRPDSIRFHGSAHRYSRRRAVDGGRIGCEVRSLLPDLLHRQAGERHRVDRHRPTRAP
ncbi:hypothetical protein [Rhodococcus koreensis]